MTLSIVRTLTLLTLLSTLTCCGQPMMLWHWEHPHKTEEEFAADKMICRKYAAEAVSGMVAGTGLGQEYFEVRYDAFVFCMEVKGWLWEWGSKPERSAHPLP